MAAAVLDSAQTVADGTVLAFTTPCALNAGSDACAVAGGDCVYSATSLVLDSAQVCNMSSSLLILHVSLSLPAPCRSSRIPAAAAASAACPLARRRF